MNAYTNETALKAALAMPRELLINGQWRAAVDGRTAAIHDPATGQEIAQISHAGEQDVDAAVRAAQAALSSTHWRDITPAVRERMILRFADLIEEHADLLAGLETLNNGKLLANSRGFDVLAGAQWVRYMAGWATKIEGLALDVSASAPGTRFQAIVKRQPAGVVAAIVPWNYPLLMAIWKIAPALATGCTLVLKPSEETPLTALKLAELALQAGIPPGVFNVITGDGATGAALVRHPGVNKVAFTGSTEVGRIIGQQCGHDIKRVSLELGGKSPVIVLDDVDVQSVIAGASSAIFYDQGQVCTAGSRLYVHKKHFDEVVDGVAQAAKNLRLGSGFDPQSQIGPLISAKQRQRVLGLIETGEREGAELLAGGASPEGAGYFVQPTVFAHTSGKPLTLVREEVFGPVLVAQPFDDIEEVIRQANDTPYGLAASVWTRNISNALRTAERIEAGTVWINTHLPSDPNIPFGGFKQSGIGRENGRAAIEAYTETKSIVIAY